ncbi:PD-(D/E)XK nuclease family protein [Companilactobacillus metriopterae]|uniref:PD-(D/E)XK nuclease family protein n=1 Tax=Companilactobacillus metriopterae TaxID=1909267 RepID=UPI00100AF5A7|nr:PD-(D/E)XK nuclease family protein [Companilactobacillus metriopterae]
MTLNFILGKNKVDHHQKIQELFENDYQKNPKNQFFFLVPNHIKFESEIEWLNRFGQITGNSDIVAANNVQVFSISRLIWYLLRDTDLLDKESITTTKSAMILRNIVNSNQSNLKLFSGMVNKQGFISDLVSQFDELISGAIEPDDLDLIENDQSNKNKIAELKLIYEQYVQEISQFETNSSRIDELIEYLNTNDCKNMNFYISDFSSFTATEYKLIEALIINGNSINVSLIMDEPAIELPEKTDYFYRVKKTFNQLFQVAKNNKIPFHSLFADKSRINIDIERLEDFWLDSNAPTPISKPESLENDNSIQIWKASDKQTEISIVSTYIRQLVATQDYRYKDFLIVTRDLSQYESFIESLLENNQIPYYIDIQSKMANHPLKKMVDLLFEIMSNNFRSSDIIALLRTELLIPEDQFESEEEYRLAVDLLENYVIANGINFKKAWFGEDFANPDLEDENLTKEFILINSLKKFIRDIFTELMKYLDNSKNNLEAISNLYSFLEEKNVFSTLKQWSINSIENNDLRTADKIDQVVNKFNSILDEFIDVFGDEKFDDKLLIQVLDSGFETANYSQIPSTLDAVSVSEIGMVQPLNRKIIIVIGSTSNNMPGATTTKTILNNEERVSLANNLNDDYKYLREDDEIINNSEPYLHGLIFSSAKERIIFTYPNITEDDNYDEVSSYVQRIQNHFNLTKQSFEINPNPSTKVEGEILRYVGSDISTLNFLTRASRTALDNREDLSSGWKYIRDSLVENIKERAQITLSSLDYRNIPENLSPQLVEDLYGKKIDVSVSRLQTFYENEYEYFLKYGLKLNPRTVYEVSPMQIGNLFHGVLDGFVKKISQENIDIRDLSNTQLNKLVDELFINNLNQSEFNILRSSQRMNYIAQKIKNTILTTIYRTQNQFKKLSSNPKSSEVTFGLLNKHQDIKGLTIPIDDRHVINVRGKIDRIDEMIFDNKSYLTVIDYKSSTRDFLYKKFMSGLNLQLTTYLQSVQDNLPLLASKPTAEVAGGFYEHIQNPVISYDESKNNDSEIEKKFKLKGLILNDETLLESYQPNLSGRSDILPINKTKNGIKIAKNSSVNSEELNLILRYNTNLIKEAGKKIYSGQLNLNPYRDGTEQTALQYSDYKPIMVFDAMLQENNYNDIQSYDKETALQKIREDLGED